MRPHILNETLRDYLLAAGSTLTVTLLVLLIPNKKVLNNKSKTTLTPPLKIKAEIPQIALLANGNIAKSFHKKISLDWEFQKTPKEIIYGNESFGFFSLKNFEAGATLDFSIVPFAFNEPINFCVRDQKGKVQWVSQKIYKNSRPVVLKNIRTETEGQFSHNFFLLSAQFVPDENNVKNRSFLPIVVNKKGEVIWGHLPQNGRHSFSRYATTKPLGNGNYGILFGEKYSYFEKFNHMGEIEEHIFPKRALEPYVVHHDFVYLGDSKLLTLGHKVYFVRNWFSLQKDFLNPVLAFLKPTSFLSTPVEIVDIKSNTKKTLWDPINYFNPLDEKLPWARNERHAALRLQQKARNFTLWGEPDAKVDWTHANTIEYYPGVGILVSMRNLSKVALIDEHTHEVLWTLGNSSDDTFQTLNERHAFYHQHHVQVIKGGYILMMDNHSSPPAPNNIGSRVLIYGLDKTTGKARVVWNYQPHSHIQIGNRGSAYLLDNDNILAFYPASLGASDYMVEVDRKTGQPAGFLKIYFTDIKRNFSSRQIEQMKASGQSPLLKIREGGGNRAVPIHTIGAEKRVKDVVCSH